MELPVIPVAIGFVVLLLVVNWWGISESLTANLVLTAVLGGASLAVAQADMLGGCPVSDCSYRSPPWDWCWLRPRSAVWERRDAAAADPAPEAHPAG